MKKRLWILGVPIAMLLILTPLLAGTPEVKPAKIEEITQVMSSDYPVFSDIEQMAEAADVILIGQYTEFLSTWNMDRNPENPVEEDPTSYSEGRLYSFDVEKVLKGSAIPDTIRVNMAYSTGAKYSVGDVDGVEQVVEYQIPTQYYIEPELGEQYLLFLSYGPLGEIYFSYGEPSSFLILPGGGTELKSNLFNPEEGVSDILEAGAQSGDTLYHFNIHASDIGRYENFLAGMTLDELEAEIASVVEEAPAA